LTTEWRNYPRSTYVWNRDQFNALDVQAVDHVLGLFSPSHMAYEQDRAKDPAGEPSLSEMTEKAIDILKKNEKGFVLMVEGGRIDHAHHEVNAQRALTETIEFANAVSVALRKTDRRDTLIIVTADHSHVFTIAGYPTRGNSIIGYVVGNDARGEPESEPVEDAAGRPYTTLGYTNGPAHPRDCDGKVNSGVAPDDPAYRQGGAVPMGSETHGGEDVPLYADGPMAHLFHGVMEQHVIFHVMAAALAVGSPGDIEVINSD